MHTLVLGASSNPTRYAYKAIQLLIRHGHEVVAVGRGNGAAEGVKISETIPEGIRVDTVTIYLKRENQTPYYKELLNLKPRRIIFNPGAENPELARLAAEAGIQVEFACTLVLLNTGQY